MAHYRRGHKVPVMATRQRDVAGLLTVGFVFVLVAATAWRPLWFGLPSLVVVLGLMIFDYAVVDSAEPGSLHGARDADADADDLFGGYGPDVAAVAAAQTTAYRANRDTTDTWRAPPTQVVAPPLSPPPRPRPRRASWLDAPPDPLDDPSTGAVDMRAYLD